QENRPMEAKLSWFQTPTSSDQDRPCKRKIPGCARRSREFSIRRNSSVRRSYRSADADVDACVTSNILVPLSSRTFLPAEVITDPSVEFAALLFRLKPLMPNTRRLVGVTSPDAVRPPCVRPAALAAPPTVECTAPVWSCTVRGTVLAAL